jgi:uncharacterized membrane protein YqiK
MVVPVWTLAWVVLVPIGLWFVLWLLGARYIPHHRVGIVEKLWSRRGSLTEGRLIALEGEAGFQAAILRGGVHLPAQDPDPDRLRRRRGRLLRGQRQGRDR